MARSLRTGLFEPIGERTDFITDGLVLYLPLYELDGDTFASKDAYGHLCTATGALWRPEGRYFDGTDDVINVADHTSLDPTEAITIITWVNHGSLDDIERALVTKYAGVGQRSWLLYWSNARARWEFTVDGTGVGASVTGGAINTWFHITGTYDRVTHKIYRNSVKGTDADADEAIPISTATVEIGDNAALSYDLIGYIGEVWFYNRALALSEIQHNYLVTKWRYQ